MTNQTNSGFSASTTGLGAPHVAKLRDEYRRHFRLWRAAYLSMEMSADLLTGAHFQTRVAIQLKDTTGRYHGHTARTWVNAARQLADIAREDAEECEPRG